MKTRHLRRANPARRGLLTLEWILLITVVVIGIIAGLGAVRTAILSELKDLADAVEALSTPLPAAPAAIATPGPEIVPPGGNLP